MENDNILELNEISERIAKLHTNIKKSPKARLTYGFIQTKLQCLEEYWSRYQTAYNTLLKSVTPDQRKNLEIFKKDVYADIEEKFINAKADLLDLMQAVHKTDSSKLDDRKSDQSPEKTHTPQVKLPRVQLPTFSGNYEDWPTFKDLFTSLVDENSSISSVQKLHYLKLSVSGEAEALLKHINVTRDNYNNAWQVLLNRYDNKRMIMTYTLKRLFDQRKMNNQTANQIKLLLDTTTESLNNLKNLNIDVDTWDPIIIHIVVQKLDIESHKEWEEYVSGVHNNDLPKLTTLTKFLETKFRTLELTTPFSPKGRPTIRSYHVTTHERTCPLCKNNHALCSCKDFVKMDPAQRSLFVKNNSICYNCLVPGHAVKSCRLSTSCRICRKRHHTLLHEKRSSNVEGSSVEAIQPRVLHSNVEETENIQINTTMTSHSHANAKSTVLLATAIVSVTSELGNTTTLRALIDPGSQGCLITEKAVQLLKCTKYPVRGTLLGVGSNSSKVSSVVQVEVLSKWQSNVKLKINAYVISKQLTKQIPAKPVSVYNWSHLQGLTLADAGYHTPGSIDLLLGVDEYAQILENEIIKGPPGSPCAQKTKLGWILFGKIDSETRADQSIVVMHQQVDVDDMLKVLWEQDLNTKRKLTKEEEICENLYRETYTRNKEGRYIVHLPLRQDPPRSIQGNTEGIALNRLKQLKQRLDRNENLKNSYTQVMNEYISRGYIEEITQAEIGKESIYLCHHAVVRDDKETTKVRIVFDASCKDVNGFSLNDDLMVGPVIQEDLRSIIMRWRMHRICFTCDIEKMYTQILVKKEHADYQRILWYENDMIKHYRLLTVIFGTASAPYLAIKTLQKIAEDEGKDFPLAESTIKEDFYVDDAISGCDDVDQAIKMGKELQKILAKGGMKLQKWSSNNLQFLQSINPDLISTKAKLDLKIDGTVKALGVSWNLNEDVFYYVLKFPFIHINITKRTILADLQRLFDPLGWVAPAIVRAKILVQQLWLQGVPWDEPLEDHLKNKWIDIRNDLKNVTSIKINRWLSTYQSAKDQISLHGFSDASMYAMSAVVYCRVKTSDGSITTSIVAARTKVAPVKTISLPRLELCGAVLLAKLLHHVAQAMRLAPTHVYAWTDASVVLAWLFGDPGRWKPFVANRVVEILEHINNNQWHHVRSEDNPADVASRGSSIAELKHNTLWWHGPQWLSEKNIEFVRPHIINTELEKRNTQKTYLSLTVDLEEHKTIFNFEHFESLTELKNVIAFCRRFLYYKKWKDMDKALSTRELDEALKICIRIEQKKSFEEDIDRIIKKNMVKRTSSLKSLNPYLDAENILRVGGRLRHANLCTESKNPIILNNKNSLTLLIVADAHQKTMHGGVQLMLGYIRSRFWIIKAASVIKTHIHKCLICAKLRAKSASQMMGDLPSVRTTPARAFQHSGVDFSGPHSILMSRTRGARSVKAYIAIFICMCTKAIHIELVGDLTSQAFIDSFRRFVARRGRCSQIWSDQGRNFIAANKELVAAWQEAQLNFKGEIADMLAKDGTQWHFIPPYSPNFGGLWEAGVKSIKFHLKRIVPTTKLLTYEELTTLLCQIESCLNSRPLSPIDETDVDNINPLTPGHFLIGESLITVPWPDLRETHVSHLDRWHHMQKLLQDFWHRWRNEYLTRLQQRPKWLVQKTDFNIGDIVLIKQDNLPPGKWAMGRIVAKHPGPDNLTRVYSVKSGSSISKRCISKLCHLPINTGPQND